MLLVRLIHKAGFVDGADVTKEAISDGYPKQKKPYLVVRCLAYVPSSDLGIE